MGPKAYFAAAGVNPKDVENQIIDQLGCLAGSSKSSE